MSLIDDRRAIFDGLTLYLEAGIQMEKAVHEIALMDREMLECPKKFIGGQRPQPPRSAGH
jgi:hypothetical protein